MSRRTERRLHESRLLQVMMTERNHICWFQMTPIASCNVPTRHGLEHHGQRGRPGTAHELGAHTIPTTCTIGTGYCAKARLQAPQIACRGVLLLYRSVRTSIWTEGCDARGGPGPARGPAAP